MANIAFFNTDNQSVGKKRVRSSKSCLVCRRKKIKCDLIKPCCGACSKRGKPELCEYQNNAWSIGIARNEDNTSPESIDQHQQPHKQASSKFINKTLPDKENIISSTTQVTKVHHTVPSPNPIKTKDQELFDFSNGPFPISNTLPKGNLAWCSVLRKDSFLYSIIASQKPKHAVILNPHDTKQDAAFTDKWKEKNPEFVKTSLFKRAQPNASNEENFNLRLQEYLSDNELCWILVEKFFESELYAYFPFIDKTEYLKQLTLLIGTKNASAINLQAASDLSIIGTLLMIMKLTYVFATYNFGNNLPNWADPKIQHLLRVPLTSKDISPLIHQIKEELIAIKPQTLQVFQFLMFEHFYDLYSPEECSCMDITDSGRLGALAQYAVQCSLNRDPLSVSTLVSGVSKFDKGRINLMRRLWYGLVLLDYTQYLKLGCPKIISEDIYDTLIPESDEASDDYLLNNNICDQLRRLKTVEPILKLIVNIRDVPTIEDFQKELQNLEHYIESFRPLNEIIKSPHNTVTERVENINSLIEFIDLHSLLLSIRCQFFHHYSRRHQKTLAYRYLMKVTQTTKVLYETILFLNPKLHPDYDPLKLFGSGVMVFPRIESALHRITTIFYITLSRIKALKMFTEVGLPKNITKVVDNIITVVYNIINHSLLIFVKASSLYFHTWVISKIHASLLKKTLTIPMGRSYSIDKTVSDVQFMTSLKDFKGYDPGFEQFTYSDFVNIFAEFVEIWEICEKDNNPVNTGDSSGASSSINTDAVGETGRQDSDFDFGVIFDNDRRWLGKMDDSYQESFIGRGADYLSNSFPSGEIGLNANGANTSTNDIFSELNIAMFDFESSLMDNSNDGV